MKKAILIGSIIITSLIASFIYFGTSVASNGGSCYLNAYQRPGEMCFICTTRSSSNGCTTGCGTEVCWSTTDPAESP